jgi:hypothetical protein
MSGKMGSRAGANAASQHSLSPGETPDFGRSSNYNAEGQSAQDQRWRSVSVEIFLGESNETNSFGGVAPRFGHRPLVGGLAACPDGG